MEAAWRCSMRYWLGASVLLAFGLFTLIGCHRSLPEAYGIYVDTNHGRLPLQGEAVVAAGNVLSSIAGLRGPIGPECSSLQDFIVYEKDVPPTTIGLARLEFAADGEVATFLSPTRIAVNLWVPKESIQLDVKPVEERRDMYIISPRKRLEKGFYALYLGSFGSAFGETNRVYDVVIGASKDFPSFQDRLELAKREAGKVTEQMNQILNKGDYGHLADVYRPDGRILSGEELQTFIKGNLTWLGSAGKVVKSEITTVNISDSGRSVQCAVKTTYEKVGVQNEALILKKIGDQYFVTQMH